MLKHPVNIASSLCMRAGLRQDIISADVALTAKIPVFTYGECLLKCTAEHVLMMQPMAMVKPRNWDRDDGEIE